MNREFTRFGSYKVNRKRCIYEFNQAMTEGDIKGNGQLFTIGIMAPQHPKSVGEIRLRSADPFDYPIIDPHYLEDPYDMGCFIRGIHTLKFSGEKIFTSITVSKKNK